MIVVLGVDPGLASLGWCWLDWSPTDRHVRDMGTIRTSPRAPLQERLQQIYDVLRDATGFKFDVLGIEEQHGAWVGKQQREKMGASAVTHRVAEGVVRTLPMVAGAPLVEVTPMQIRAALALPRGASKEQMRAMVLRICTGLPKRLSQHAADSAAIALTTGARWSVMARTQRRPNDASTH